MTVSSQLAIYHTRRTLSLKAALRKQGHDHVWFQRGSLRGFDPVSKDCVVARCEHCSGQWTYHDNDDTLPIIRACAFVNGTYPQSTWSW